MIVVAACIISLVLLLPYTLAENVTVVADLKEFRVGEVRSAYVFPIPLGDSENVDLQCADINVCYIPTDNWKSYEDGFNVTVEAVFLGITEIVVTSGDEVVARYTVRVLRAQKYNDLMFYFKIVGAFFLFGVTFSMGTQLEWNRIVNELKTPIGPAIGMFCQAVLMPIVGFCLAEFVLPPDQFVLKLALFTASTCPGGGKSSFWTIIFGGNLDLSVAMTFTQSISAMVMMSLWISTVGKRFTTQRLSIPLLDIAMGLLFMFILPTAVGMFFIQTKPHLVKDFRVWTKRFTWFTAIILAVLGVYVNWYVFLLFTWPAVICGCLLPWSGYIIALITSALLGRSRKDIKTIAIETGLQNVGIAMALMIWCFPEPEVDFSMSILFCVALATDKPLIAIYLANKIKKRWFAEPEDNKNPVKQQVSNMEKRNSVRNNGSLS